MFFFSLRRTFLAPAARVLGGIRQSLLRLQSGRRGWKAGASSWPSLDLLLACDGALGALAGARVGLGALSADGQALAVPATLIAADLDLAADVCLDLATEVTLDLVVGFDGVAELDQLVVAQVLHSGVRVDPGRGEDLLGAGTADAVDVGECDLDALVAREVNTDEACHEWLFLSRATAALRTSRWSGRVASRASWLGLRPSVPEVVSAL